MEHPKRNRNGSYVLPCLVIQSRYIVLEHVKGKEYEPDVLLGNVLFPKLVFVECYKCTARISFSISWWCVLIDWSPWVSSSFPWLMQTMPCLSSSDEARQIFKGSCNFRGATSPQDRCRFKLLVECDKCWSEQSVFDNFNFMALISLIHSTHTCLVWIRVIIFMLPLHIFVFLSFQFTY